MTTQEELIKLVRQIQIENTLSPDALEALTELQTNYSESLEAIVGYEKLISEADERAVKDQQTITGLEKELASANNEITVWNTREQDLIQKEKDVYKREVKMDMVDQRAIIQEQRVSDLKEVMGIVFKNPVIRRTVMENGSTPVASPGSATSPGYVSSYQVSKTTTETEEEVEPVTP